MTFQNTSCCPNLPQLEVIQPFDKVTVGQGTATIEPVNRKDPVASNDQVMDVICYYLAL